MTTPTTQPGPSDTRPAVFADGGAVRTALRRAEARLVASDPGLARLGMAGTTVVGLAVSLGVLYTVTTVAGQPFTVALLGVVISMIASMAFNDPQPRQRIITAAAMLVIAAATVTFGALLAPYTVPGDVVFVAIMAAATAARRFGQRGSILGMVAFMTYFFALFLGATVAMLPWLITALAIGAAVSLGVSFAPAQHPERRLRRSLRALDARLGLLLTDLADTMAGVRLDEPRGRRLRRRLVHLRETTLMIDSQLSSQDTDPRGSVRAADLGPVEKLKLQLFDLELAAEHLIAARVRAGTAEPTEHTEPIEHTRPAEPPLPDHDGRLADALALLAGGLGRDGTPDQIADAATLARSVHTDSAAAPTDRLIGLALADLVVEVVGTQKRARTLPAGSLSDSGSAADPDPAEATEDTEDTDAEDTDADDTAGPVRASWTRRLAPSTRQAVQVTVASSLAIVAGELLSPARWYWAVIAAFVIYSGTETRGQTLTRGRQRILGTVAGVAVGTIVASLVTGNVPVSIALIFLALFTGFYLRQVSYLFMVIGTTTMLALLYGLLGEFTIALLVTRIEETAIGAVIGIATAVFVLPTSTRTTVAEDTGQFLDELADLVAAYGTGLTTPSDTALTTQVRDLDRHLATLRAGAAPLSTGLLGFPTRGEIVPHLDRLSALDHYARELTRVAASPANSATTQAIQNATGDVVANLQRVAERLGTAHRGSRLPAPRPAGTALDHAQTSIDDRTQLQPARDRDQQTAAVKYLRQIDRATHGLARDLGLAADPSLP